MSSRNQATYHLNQTLRRDQGLKFFQEKLFLVGPFEVWGGEGGSEKVFLANPSKVNMSQVQDFGNLRCDLGWFGDVQK